MTPADHILLAQLLRAREAAFVTVWECELRIRQRLAGAEFPFPAPPDLPSRRRRSRPPLQPGSGAAAAATVRRLRPGEDAYRLIYVYSGARRESLSDTPDGVRALLAAAPADLTPLRLDTVALDAAGAPSVVACLWSAVPPEPL